ncbi:hypothetical protein ACSAZL_06385 [Methanosarcina sp. T3]|uniref:hypothetical protein n=1 Tax=Methanosarcina sp. T3 TaxID=3439062 RepID=UPI003F878E4A
MSPESNQLAASNGCEMENIIKALYPGAEFHYKGVIDFSIDGVRVEVKSCQELINASGSHDGIRSGRFCFKDIQQQTLIENNGEYIFIVHRGGVPIFYARIPAVKLKLGKFTGVKAVCWKTIIRGAV